MVVDQVQIFVPIEDDGGREMQCRPRPRDGAPSLILAVDADSRERREESFAAVEK